MDFETDVIKMMAEQQGIELPPPAATIDTTAAAPSVSPRSGRSSAASGHSQEYLASVDLEAGLVSTRSWRKSPAAPDPEPEPEKDDDVLLYEEENAADVTDTASSAAVAAVPAAPKTSTGLLGSQYMDDTQDEDPDDGDENGYEDDEPIDQTEESPASPPPEQPVNQPVDSQMQVDREPELIPLLDEDGDGELLPADEIEDSKQTIADSEPPVENEIPGLGSPVRDMPPADPVVESVVEDMGHNGDRVGEEEDDIRMHDDPVAGDSNGPEWDERTAVGPDMSPPSNASCFGASFDTKENVTLAAHVVAPESESPSARVTRSSAARVTSPIKIRISEPVAAPVVTTAAAIPPLKIKLVPVSSGTVTYQLSQNDPPPASTASPPATNSGKRVSKKLTTPETTAHPIIVQKKSQTKSSPADQQSSSSSSSGRKISPATENRKKKSQSSPQAAAAEPCLNCGKASVSNKMWDNEYCSHECVFFYVQKVFQQMYPTRPAVPAETTDHKDQKERTQASLKSST